MKTAKQACLTGRQAIKHILTGAVADAVDIGVFNLLFWLLPFELVIKAISFLVAVAIKYIGNKYWAFEKPEKDGIKKEIAQFLAVTLIGLLINVASFYFFVRMETGINLALWREASVILALLVTAVWNFTSYKFLVFKK